MAPRSILPAVVLLALAACDGESRSNASAASSSGSPSGPTTYVLVHGGWHGPWAWEKTVPLLEEAGDHAVTPTLPSHGDDATPPAEATLAGYVNAVVAAVDAADGNVVLVGHSMAGAVISEAAEARPDRVRLLVYLAAMLLEDGQTVTSKTGNDSEAVLGKHLIFDAGNLTIDPAFAGEALYGDCSDADASAAIARLGVEPLVPLITPIHVSDEAWGKVPRIYIHTLDDKAVSPGAQEAMFTALPCEQIVTMTTSHSPFYCGPASFVESLRAAVAASGK